MSYKKNIYLQLNSSLIKILYKEYGVETCATFLNNIQFLTNRWLMISSFSIHAGDCIKQKEVWEPLNSV